MKLAIAITATSILLASCATSPERIEAAYISPEKYSGWSCEKIAGEEKRLSTTLSIAYAKQNGARTTDIIGWITFGVPLSTLSGQALDTEISRLKGERNSLKESSLKSNCPIAFPEIKPALKIPGQKRDIEA